jgi:hypothetical protein
LSHGGRGDESIQNELPPDQGHGCDHRLRNELVEGEMAGWTVDSCYRSQDGSDESDSHHTGNDH